MTQGKPQYDAIVIGAGHNGLTSALVLQRAGLRVLLLESKRYAGGMASNVELFDGYTFEIAGSVQISTAAEVSRELGLDTLPTVDLEVMSVSLLGDGDEPLIYYTDPMRLIEHLVGVHGEEVVNAMAMLAAWSTAPAKALGRFEARTLPRTLDEMYACATNAFERQSIDDLIYGSVTDVLDRFIPDKDKHGALRGMLSFLAIKPSTAARRHPAPRRPWPTASRCLRPRPSWSPRSRAASGCSPSTCSDSSRRPAASFG
jgi:phytoene dehydrogenase-like protein